jgi:hypothetical protein
MALACSVRVMGGKGYSLGQKKDFADCALVL